MNNGFGTNSLTLGRIPGSGSGFRKTYEESIFMYVDNDIVNSFLRDKEKVYYVPNLKTIQPESYFKYHSVFMDDYREYVVLAISQFNLSQFNYYSSNHETLEPYFVVEVIDKEILHRHLVEERMILEDMRRGSSEKENELALL